MKYDVGLSKIQPKSFRTFESRFSTSVSTTCGRRCESCKIICTIVCCTPRGVVLGARPTTRFIRTQPYSSIYTLLIGTRLKCIDIELTAQKTIETLKNKRANIHETRPRRQKKLNKKSEKCTGNNEKLLENSNGLF